VLHTPSTLRQPTEALLSPTPRSLKRALRPGQLCLIAALLIACVFAPQSLAAAHDRGQSLATVIATERAHSRAQTTDPGIQLGLAFDFDSAAAASIGRDVSYVFGGYFLDWKFGFYPSGPELDGFIPFDLDPYPPSEPGNSLSAWQNAHPDWVIYKCNGTTPAYFGSGNSNVPLDFSNPAVRTWQVQQAALLLKAGATGIAVDDFNFTNYAGRCGVYRNGIWWELGYPRRGWIDDRYTTDMVTWLADFSAQLKQEFPTTTIAVNMSPSESGLRDVQTVTPYIDTDFDEAGFTGEGAQNLSGPAWLQEVKALQYLNQHGKAVDVNGIVDASSERAVTSAQVNWILGNYLLVKGKRTYTYIYAGNHGGYARSPSGYGSFYDRRAYHAPIGYATSPIVRYNGVYARGYSGGMTIVNPSATETQTVPLGGTYIDMFGRRYTSVTLGPTSAIVLLRSRSQRTRAVKPVG